MHSPPVPQYKELQFKETESAASSFILEYYRPAGPFNVNPHLSEDPSSAILLSQDELSKLPYLTYYMHIDVKYQNETQNLIQLEREPQIADLEDAIKSPLEYVGVHEQWKLYRLKNRS